MSQPTLLQHAESPSNAQWVNGATSGQITFGSPCTAGSLRTIKIKQVGATPVAIQSVVGSQSGPWNVRPATVNGAVSSIQFAYLVGALGTTAETVTVTFVGAVAVAVGSIGEFSPIQNIRDVTVLATIESATGTSTAPSATLQAGQVGDLVITIADGGISNTHAQYTAPTGRTGIQVQGFVDVDSFAWAWGVATTDFFNAEIWTLGVSAGWGTMVLSFAPPISVQPPSPATATSAFPGGDQNPLAGAWSTWGSAGALKQVANNILATTTSGWCGAYWNAGAAVIGDGTYQYSEIIISAADVAGSLRGAGVRMSANGQPTSGYMAIASGTGVYDLQKMVNGTPTIIGTAVASAVSIGDRVGVLACQNVIALFKNGACLVAVFDASVPAGGAPGMVFNQGGNAINSKINSWNGGLAGDPRFYQSSVYGHDDNLTVESGPYTGPNLKGSLLFCCMGWPDVGGDPSSSFLDSNGNVWVKLPTTTLLPFGQTIFYCLNGKAGANTAQTTRVGNGHNVNTIAEYANPNGTGWTLVGSTSNNGSETTVAATIPGAIAGDLLIGYLASQSNTLQSPLPYAAYRAAMGGEVKLYDATASVANSGGISAILMNGLGNGLPAAAAQQAIALTAFRQNGPVTLPTRSTRSK